MRDVQRGHMREALNPKPDAAVVAPSQLEPQGEEHPLPGGQRRDRYT